MTLTPADQLIAVLTQAASELDAEDAVSASRTLGAVQPLIARARAEGLILPLNLTERLRELHRRCGSALGVFRAHVHHQLTQVGTSRRAKRAYSAGSSIRR